MGQEEVRSWQKAKDLQFSNYVYCSHPVTFHVDSGWLKGLSIMQLSLTFHHAPDSFLTSLYILQPKSKFCLFWIFNLALSWAAAPPHKRTTATWNRTVLSPEAVCASCLSVYSPCASKAHPFCFLADLYLQLPAAVLMRGKTRVGTESLNLHNIF